MRLSLSLSLLVGLAAPALAERVPDTVKQGDQAVVDSDGYKHEFNRGESIYAAPDADKLLKYSVIKNSKTAINELAEITVAFKGIKDLKDRLLIGEVKFRELALRKVNFYHKYKLGPALLKVPQSKMGEYLAFWPNFWNRVDQFAKDNKPLGPGPWPLPSVRTQRIATLKDGTSTLLSGLAQAFSVKVAAASDASSFLTRDVEWPSCGNVLLLESAPLIKCNPYEPETFYYQVVGKTNAARECIESSCSISSEDPLSRGPFTIKAEIFSHDDRCKTKEMSSRATVELTLCGSEAGDNAGKDSAITFWATRSSDLAYFQWWASPIKLSPGKQGRVVHNQYCLPSSDRHYSSLQDSYESDTEIDTPPDWFCD